MRDNKDIFSSEEMGKWINKSNCGLMGAERYLIEKYMTQKNSNILEAGTGGGRIAFNLKEMGFKSVDAFDYVPEMIEFAQERVKQTGAGINFFVADAANLDKVPDNYYHYAVYLQQVVSCIPPELIRHALSESYRVLRKNGTVIFSFLHYGGRTLNKIVSLLVNTARLMRGEKPSRHMLPWITLGGKPNWRFMQKNQAALYWFDKDEIVNILHDTGFRIIEVLTFRGASQKPTRKKGMLYVVCEKQDAGGDRVES